MNTEISTRPNKPVLAGIIEFAVAISLLAAFAIHSKHLAELEEMRGDLYSRFSFSYQEGLLKTYEIIKHFRVEYPITSIVEAGDNFPEGEIKQITFHGHYPQVEAYTEGTEFISVFLKNVIDTEASYFNARFKRQPSVEEMNDILGKVVYFGYTQSLLNTLYEMSCLKKAVSYSPMDRANNARQLDSCAKRFEKTEQRLQEILKNDPSRLSFSEVHFVSPR